MQGMPEPGGHSPAAERCVCVSCGAHVSCRVGLATLGGQCGVCGGTTLNPLVRWNGRPAGGEAAGASVAELGVMSNSGYRAIVLDRLAQQTAEVLSVDQSCIFARDRSHADMSIVAAGRGEAEQSIGKRVQASAEHWSGSWTPDAAVALNWDGEAQGALAVGRDLKARRFTPREIAILESLGEAASAALAHARSRPPFTGGDVRDAIRGMAISLADFDAYTAEHSRQVVDTALAVGSEAGLSRAGLAELSVAALLHDIGKIRVPGSILNKPGPLTDAEREVVAQHPGFGAEALLRVPGLEVVSTVVRYHHEWWDGSGYPDGLSGTRIPLASRVIAVCDAYSAITSDRAYRAAQSPERALAELHTAAGWQFDPEIVSHFEAVAERQVLA
jgi:HD-GYP domain-containing protein (c-di-GMP phosphodiesterase class II)